MDTMASQITSLTFVYSIVIQAQTKENIKALRHWPLCGEFTGTGEFPVQRASNAEMFPFDDVIMWAYICDCDIVLNAVLRKIVLMAYFEK